MTDDEELVLSWLVWNVRQRDLPAHIREALARIAPAHERPPEQTAYVQGRYHMVVFPDNKESTPMIDSYPLDPGAALSEALANDPLYVLISDTRFEGESEF